MGNRYQRRITRSSLTPSLGGSYATKAPHNLKKRQSLIPFPRTGKRSGDGTINKELDQFYVFENEDEEDDETESMDDKQDMMYFYDESDDEDAEENPIGSGLKSMDHTQPKTLE